jgi:molecular chaperone GrpE
VSKQGLENPDGEAVQSSNGGDTVDRQDPTEALAALADQCAAEKAELQDRILRAQAEFQNFRRRAEKERLEFSEYASSEAVLTLLPVLDDFERALQAESTGDDYAKGMQLIYQRFYDSLKKLGLEPIDSVGKPFNPHVHHAVEKEETDQEPADTVLAEYQRAYNFKGRLLRAAMVKVAVPLASKE